jgi:hypothetical protein
MKGFSQRSQVAFKRWHRLSSLCRRRLSLAATEKQHFNHNLVEPVALKTPHFPKYSGAAWQPPLAWEERRKEKEFVLNKARITSRLG